VLEPQFLDLVIMQNNLKISFIGGGNMATALIGGLAGKLTAGGNIHVIDKNPDSLQGLQQTFGVSAGGRIDSAIARSDVIVLSVKPQQIRAVVAELSPHLSSQLVLSIAAGIRTSDLTRWLRGYQAIVRTMPNTPALIGKGITGMFAVSSVSDGQRNMADAILRAVGATIWVDDESMLDAVTAMSGSGPAYVFYFIEAMQLAGQKMGFTAGQATQLALATFSGATELAMKSADPISILRERVTSPGGTTFAAIASMERGGVKDAIVAAIEAAAARSEELGEQFGRES